MNQSADPRNGEPIYTTSLRYAEVDQVTHAQYDPTTGILINHYQSGTLAVKVAATDRSFWFQSPQDALAWVETLQEMLQCEMRKNQQK